MEVADIEQTSLLSFYYITPEDQVSEADLSNISSSTLGRAQRLSTDRSRLSIDLHSSDDESLEAGFPVSTLESGSPQAAGSFIRERPLDVSLQSSFESFSDAEDLDSSSAEPTSTSSDEAGAVSTLEAADSSKHFGPIYELAEHMETRRGK